MAKKNFYLIIDTETTQDQLVADFGAVVIDTRGRVQTQCGVLLDTIYNDSRNHPLFFTSDVDGIWSKNGQDKRYGMYNRMLQSGTRMLASVNAVNRWLERVKGQYNPYLTAYNFPFDRDKCKNTEIDLTIFGDKYFCLWAAAITKWGHTQKFRQFVLDTHCFNMPTELGNMTYKTNAEIMTRFVLNDPDLPDEPHTGLEDILYYELPVLKKLLTTETPKKLMASTSYNWREFQVKDGFKAI